MSDFIKLNGYYVKDNTARNNIGNIEELRTANKDNLVDAINEITSTKPPYKQINPIQALSISMPLDTSIQGMCIDDNNNAYIYVIDDGTYGTLYKYDLIHHTLLNTISLPSLTNS